VPPLGADEEAAPFLRTTRWRSVLFVPADRPDLAAKAAASDADAVVLDLEDAVPAARKDAARKQLGAGVAHIAGATTTLVRVNPPGGSHFNDDVAALPHGVDALIVPKLESTDDLARVRAATALPLVAGIETVLGVLDARAVLVAPVIACYFGAEDYVADLGGARGADNAEVTTARSLVGMAARIAGIPALDIVTIDFGDDTRFVREAREARALGYGGKLCIHPRQVPLANAAFLPSADEIVWAKRLLAAFDDAGHSTIAFEGQMVDEVVAARARAIVDASSRA
jgi:citrate lyase subunit beta/citryl-CoA lyase